MNTETKPKPTKDKLGGILLLGRHRASVEAVKWCRRYDIDLSPLNIVTALCALGIIKDIPE